MPKVRAGVTYAHINGRGNLRGLNLNPIVNGIRPDLVFGNVVEVIGDAASRQNTVNSFLQVMLSPPTPNPSKQLLDWKRNNFGVNYTYGQNYNNTDGAFSVSPTGSLGPEWGPAGNDIRYRVNAFFGSQTLRNLNANLNVSYSSASPYTIRTGVDTNGDT